MREERAERKVALRRQLLAARYGVPADTRKLWSEAICDRVRVSPAFGRAIHVVAYVPCGAEVDPTGAAAATLGAGRRLYYPCTDGRVEARRAHAVVPGTEPEELLSRNAGDVLFLVPGVGFDERGGRLGRGRGWYDRLLARFDRSGRIGLAFEVQMVSRLPLDPWDVGMHAVLTERRSIETSQATALSGESA